MNPTRPAPIQPSEPAEEPRPIRAGEPAGIGAIPKPGVDASGRAIPISDEERSARYEDLRRRLAEIDAEDDTPEELSDQVFRNIDEERHRQGRSPAFEGYY